MWYNTVYQTKTELRGYMLFHKRTKKIAKYFWVVIGALIILSMILFFAPGLIPGIGY